MFNVVFCEKENGESELWNFIEALRLSSPTNKDARIQYRQIILHVQMLEDNGTRLPEIITKHLDEERLHAAKLRRQNANGTTI